MPSSVVSSAAFVHAGEVGSSAVSARQNRRLPSDVRECVTVLDVGAIVPGQVLGIPVEGLFKGIGGDAEQGSGKGDDFSAGEAWREFAACVGDSRTAEPSARVSCAVPAVAMQCGDVVIVKGHGFAAGSDEGCAVEWVVFGLHR